jgi:hypothetical protein
MCRIARIRQQEERGRFGRSSFTAFLFAVELPKDMKLSHWEASDGLTLTQSHSG